MDILIEKAFLDVFEDDFMSVEHPQALLALFKFYPKLRVYSDMDFETAINNIFMRMLLNTNAKLRSKHDFKSNCLLGKLTRRSLALCGDVKEDWVTQFKLQDGLFFEASTYKEQLSEIMKNHKTIRLKDQPDFKWSNVLPVQTLPGPSALLVDKYILKSDIKINSNAIPILKLLSHKASLVTIVTETNDVNALNKKIQQILIKEKIKIKTQVIAYTGRHKYDFHDRYLISKYAIIEVGKGFDLLPIKKHKIQDHKLSIKTIFDKDAYDDLRAYTTLYTDYIKWYRENHDKEVDLPFS